MEFLKFVVGDLYKRFNGHLENVTVVLPTRRAGLFVKKYFAELVSDKPACAPSCTTITDLFDSLCVLKPVDEIKAVCMLYDIYKRQTEQVCTANRTLTLDCFYSWGRQLIADFDNVDKNHMDSRGEDIFRSSAEAHEFDKDNLDKEVKERIKSLVRGSAGGVVWNGDGEPFRKFFEQIWKEIPGIYSEFSERLRKEGYALDGARNKWVVRNFETVWQDISDTTFAFAGFNILHGTERRLMHLVDSKGKALFYWDYDKEFDESEIFIPAYRNVKRNIGEFGGMYDTSRANVETINIVSATSDNAQARYVYDWLSENHRAGQSSAIVLCDETMLHPVVFSVPEKFSENVNVTKGFPMKHTGIYARICSWLRDPANVSDGTVGMADTLRSLMVFIDEEWDRMLPDTRKVSVSSGQEWYEMLNRESVYQARCVVSRFACLVEEGVLDKMEFYTVRNLLTAHLGTVSIPFHGEPVTDIQIMGALETRTLDFDNVLLLNVEEGVIPKSGHDTSFIPYYLRKYYRLTTLDDQTQVYSYNFFRILRRSHSVTLLYSDAFTSDGQKSMSRFVMQILASDTLRSLVKRFKLVSPAGSDGLESHGKGVGTGTADKTRELVSFRNYGEKLAAGRRCHPGKDLRLSPSAINTYLRCKRSFFMKYMLGLKEPVNRGSLMQMNELGTLVHESIRAAYSIITGGSGKGRVEAQAIEAFLKDKAKTEQAVKMAYGAMNRDYCERNAKTGSESVVTQDFYSLGDHPIETTVAKEYLHNVLSNDCRLTGFRIVGNELKKYAGISIPGFGDISVGGSIDRLDTVEENGRRTIRIVDYKTGHYDEKKMKANTMEDLFAPGSDKGYVLQTMIYCLACMEDEQLFGEYKDLPVKPQLLFTQKRLLDFDPDITLGNQPVRDFRDYREEFRNSLAKLVEQILGETEFEQVPLTADTNSPCRTCAFALLCGR